MYRWLTFVFVRYVLWLLLGIVASLLLPGWADVALWSCMLSGLLYLGLVFLYKHNLLAQQVSWGCVAFLFLFFLGYWRAQEAQIKPPLPAGETPYWWAVVEEFPVATPNSYRFAARITSASGQQQELKAMVYLPQKGVESLPKPGEGLLLKGRLQQVPAPFNPHEFDYRRYLASQGIYYQLFAQAHLSHTFPEAAVSRWERMAFSSRSYFKGVVHRFIQEPEAAAVVAAMVLGQRSGLNRSLRQAYADAGVMHVLAVSGLHVGLVFGVFLFLFRYLQRHRWQRMLWFLGAVLVLWCYAWLTGLSPSSLRATWMFTFIALAKLDRRKGNIYNSIALSAFILLLWNPLLLLQVGFQLSYAAVVGIVYLQPRISDLYVPRQGWLKRVWELLAVTLAAQIATFPLGLYYFHQLPTYFFIGNLLAIPLATGILYLTLLLLLLHLVPGLNVALGWVVTGLTQLLNGWVQLTEQLPGSRLVATIHGADLALFYAALICLLLLLRYRSFAWAGLSFGLLLLLALSAFERTYSLRHQKILTIYQIPGHTLMRFVAGEKEKVLALGELPKQQQLSYHVEPSRLNAGFHTPLELPQLPDGLPLPLYQGEGTHLLVWQGLVLAIVEGALPPMPPMQPLAADVVLVRNNAPVDLQELQRHYHHTHLVMDASNSQRYRQRARAAADAIQLPLHITSEQGAIELRLH
jgi:competence protein ComEC